MKKEIIYKNKKLYYFTEQTKCPLCDKYIDCFTASAVGITECGYDITCDKCIFEQSMLPLFPHMACNCLETNTGKLVDILYTYNYEQSDKAHDYIDSILATFYKKHAVELRDLRISNENLKENNYLLAKENKSLKEVINFIPKSTRKLLWGNDNDY